jgi:serine/threonine-protein kinase RsbW
MKILRLPAKIESLEMFRSFVLGKIEDRASPESIIQRVDLVLEEVLVNVINYAYSDEGDIEVGCDDSEPDRFCVTVRDWGGPFNPLDRGEPDLTRDISEMEVGGLGIHLVRHTADELKYERKDGANTMTMVFRKNAE